MKLVWILITILYSVYLLVLCIKIIMESQSPSKAVSYILLICLLPILGSAIYLIVGRNTKKKSLYSKKLGKDLEQNAFLLKKFESFKNLQELEFNSKYDDFAPTAEMLISQHKSILTGNNELKIYKNGEEKFPDLLEALRNAKHHIHIEYYIYEDDIIGNEIADILAQKAKQGIEVRFLYDDFGSKSIRKKLVKKLRNDGVEAYPFYEIIFVLLADRLNYRNHRKIVVIDGKEAFIGGINVADKYVNKENQELYWRDTHLRIKGDAVWTLQHVFLCDWNFASEQEIGYEDCYFKSENGSESVNKTWAQITSSGPDSYVPYIQYTYISAIYAAKEYVFLCTPYFIPGKGFIQALHAAVLRGVRVVLMAPGVSDSAITNAASCSFYEELLEMGIDVFLYQKGFVHAKTVVIDDAFFMIGTANLDIRSFEFNFEVNAVIYDNFHAVELRKMFEDDLKDCIQLQLDEWRKRPVYIRFFERVVRLISDVM